jgi:hypothetical protein
MNLMLKASEYRNRSEPGQTDPAGAACSAPGVVLDVAEAWRFHRLQGGSVPNNVFPKLSYSIWSCLYSPESHAVHQTLKIHHRQPQIKYCEGVGRHSAYLISGHRIQSPSLGSPHCAAVVSYH